MTYYCSKCGETLSEGQRFHHYKYCLEWLIRFL